MAIFLMNLGAAAEFVRRHAQGKAAVPGGVEAAARRMLQAGITYDEIDRARKGSLCARNRLDNLIWWKDWDDRTEKS